MRGTVKGLERSTEGEQAVLRFRLHLPGGNVVPVEMRAEEIRGSLSEGDEVDLPVTRTTPNGVVVETLHDRTTGFAVTAWRRPFLTRNALRFGGLLASAVFGWFVPWFCDQIVGDTSDVAPSVSTAAALAGLLALIAGVVLVVLIVRVVRRPGAVAPMRLVAVAGLVVGAVVAVLTLS